jgi:CDP-glucose 4,6-dehydratase
MRAGNVIGGGDFAENRLLPDLVRAYLQNTEIVIRNPNSTRPWQHVLDPLFGYLLYIESVLNGCSQESMNFGPQGESLSVSEVVKIFKNRAPALTAHFELSGPDQQESKLLEISSDLARNVLGWKSKFSQESAIESTLEWWRSASNLTSLNEITEKTVNGFLKEAPRN